MTPDNTTVNIKIEIEPVVKMICLVIDCRFNLGREDGPHCNLKRIKINPTGQCALKEILPDND